MAFLHFMARGRWHILVLAAALVLSQGIALIHGIAHAPLTSASGQLVHADNSELGHETFADHLFGNHHDQEGNSLCHLFDQSYQPDGLCGVHTVALPAQFAAEPPVALAGLSAALWLAAFNARAPPYLR
jgi:hypothetical protein